MNSLNGKVAIVTGASKGIGAAIAKGLAEAGAAVAVNYASDREGAERAVADILAKGGKAVAIRADMSKSAEVKQLFEETKKALGSPNVLVNNAGIFEFEARPGHQRSAIPPPLRHQCPWHDAGYPGGAEALPGRGGAASSISARSRAKARYRIRAFMRRPRARWTR